MPNVSYDPTKQRRSAAGTARTTKGLSGTSAKPGNPVTSGGSNFSPTAAIQRRAQLPTGNSTAAQPFSAQNPAPPKAASDPSRNRMAWQKNFGADPLARAREHVRTYANPNAVQQAGEFAVPGQSTPASWAQMQEAQKAYYNQFAQAGGVPEQYRYQYNQPVQAIPAELQDQMQQRENLYVDASGQVRELNPEQMQLQSHLINAYRNQQMQQMAAQPMGMTAGGVGQPSAASAQPPSGINQQLLDYLNSGAQQPVV